MVKLNILNMKNFLGTVNACIGKVYMLCPNGKKQNINGEERIQDSLWRQYFQNKKLSVSYFRNSESNGLYENCFVLCGGLLICL